MWNVDQNSDKGFLTYWDTQKTKENWFQNKINGSSSVQGALHSTGCKSHLNVALGLVSIIDHLVTSNSIYLCNIYSF